MKLRFPAVVTLGIMLAGCSVFLTGCWDQREIEERISVVAIGIDKAKDDPKMIKITVQIPIPIKIAGGGGQGGGGGKGEAVKVMSSTGLTVVDAFNNMQKRLNQQLFYGHTRIIALGEDIAKEGVTDVADAFRRDPQLRRLLWPVVVKGEAAELLRANPELEQIPTVFLMSLIETGAESGRIPDMNLGKFYINLSSSSRNPYLNYFEVHGNDIKWSGIAVFRGDRMIGTLDEKETWKMIYIREKKDGGHLVFPYRNRPEDLISFSTKFIDLEDHFVYKDGRLQTRINILLEGDLLGKSFNTNFSNAKEIEQLEQDAENHLEKETKAMLWKLQKEYKVDILGIGTKVKAFHPKIWRKLDWKTDFPNADIRVTYDVKLRRTGMEME